MMSTTNIAIVNEFQMEADDYHEFIAFRKMLEHNIGLIYSYKELGPEAGSKPYTAIFTFKGIRHPAQYSADLE